MNELDMSDVNDVVVVEGDARKSTTATRALVNQVIEGLEREKRKKLVFFVMCPYIICALSNSSFTSVRIGRSIKMKERSPFFFCVRLPSSTFPSGK